MLAIKSKRINKLKENGIYYGNKEGAKVKLEHMKEHQLVALVYSLNLNDK